MLGGESQQVTQSNQDGEKIGPENGQGQEKREQNEGREAGKQTDRQKGHWRTILRNEEQFQSVKKDPVSKEVII